ncbi:MAG TPA: DNA-3-methyladenine glycosylase 2 [Armatimonadota bacterium]
MELDPTICYGALRTHDPRFDGAFFVGVSSTGIYCRPVCTAKIPRRENCSFYPSAAAAEQCGYRPCRRCRPELAPGAARIDAVGRLAGAALSRIEEGVLASGSIAGLAAEMGVSDRHLRRAIRSEFGVTPVALAQTQRLLLAKRMLTDTDLPITDVAFASGFASLRRFNALFQERYRLRPTDLRRGRRPSARQGTLVCEVGYRPPFDWEALLAFLAGRATPGVEEVDGGSYRRTAAFGRHAGWISVEPSTKRHALRVEVSAQLAPVLPAALSRVKRLFDLSAEPRQIAERLGPLAEGRAGLRVPGAFCGFETAVRTVIGQQISVQAANTLAGRLASAFGEPVETPFPNLTRITPDPERLASADPAALMGLGIVQTRAAAIVALARAVTDGRISLEPGGDVDAATARLLEVPGVGEWTAEVIAMRALSWPDAFPHTDLGVRKALRGSNSAQILDMAEAWRPWRSYAVMHLWRSLEERG